MLFSHSCSRLLFRHTGLFLTKTQINNLHSFPLKQHIHQSCRVYCISRGRITDVRRLRPFCQNICYRRRQEGHKLIDMFWKRPPKTTTRGCSHSLAFPYHSGHLGHTFTASHHPTVSFLLLAHKQKQNFLPVAKQCLIKAWNIPQQDTS